LKAEGGETLSLRRGALLAAALVAIAALRIVSASAVLSQTVDEPIHLGAGLEWLDHGSMTGDVSHPPLARTLSALGPWLAGEHWTPTGNTTTDGLKVLGHGAHYVRMLALARLGILPLFLLACTLVFLWSNRTGGPLAGVLSVFLFTTVPPVLAHAGQVTTDMAATAFTVAGAMAAIWWAEQPDGRRSAAFGAVIGLGILAKYSLVVFLPGIWGALYLCHWQGVRAIGAQVRRYWRPALVAAAVACVVVWGGFAFTFGAPLFTHLRLPAPRFLDGLHDIWDHNQQGHASYILGERHHFGVWYFFPVTLAVKTPLAMLLLSAAALFVAWRKRLRIAAPLACCAVIMAIAMSSRINIGVRHILPVYAFLAVIAGTGVAALLRDASGRAGVLVTAALFALFGWQAVSGAAAHPGYLSYTNEITGGHPERFVGESDLDWGQDMYLVNAFLEKVGAREVTFAPYNVVYLETGNPFPKVTYSNWFHAAPGWNVVSLSGWKVYNHPGWIGTRPPQFRIGRTHWAWYFAAGDVPSVDGAGPPVR
jgi:hypothetical protein